MIDASTGRKAMFGTPYVLECILMNQFKPMLHAPYQLIRMYCTDTTREREFSGTPFQQF